MTEQADKAEPGEVEGEVCTGLQLAEGEDAVVAKGCMFLWAVQHLASRQTGPGEGTNARERFGALLQDYRAAMHACLKKRLSLNSAGHRGAGAPLAPRYAGVQA